MVMIFEAPRRLYLRAYRLPYTSLSEEQQYICIEQSKVFMLVNQKRKEEI